MNLAQLVDPEFVYKLPARSPASPAQPPVAEPPPPEPPEVEEPCSRLILKVLAKATRPLTSAEIRQRLGRRAPENETAVAAYMSQHAERKLVERTNEVKPATWRITAEGRARLDGGSAA